MVCGVYPQFYALLLLLLKNTILFLEITLFFSNLQTTQSNLQQSYPHLSEVIHIPLKSMKGRPFYEIFLRKSPPTISN